MKQVAAKNWAGSLHRWWDNSNRSYPDNGPPFPRPAVVAIAGDVGFGSATAYLSQVTGNAIGSNGFFPSASFVNPVSWIGRFALAIIAGSFNGWTSGARDRADLFEGVKQILHPFYQSPYLFDYIDFERYKTTLTANPNPEWNAQVDAQGWALRDAAGSGGSPVVSWDDSTTAEVNHLAAWPNAVGSIAKDASFVGTVLSPDGITEGPAEWAADYFASRGMVRAGSYTGTVCGAIAGSSYADSRWSFIDKMKCPNADGFFVDNMSAETRVAGFYDRINNYVANDFTSAAVPWMLRGGYRFFTQFQRRMGQAYPSRTYYNFCNVGSWANSFQTGNSGLWSALAGTLHGGDIEHVMGKSFSLETTNGWLATKQAYSAIMDFFLPPKLAIFSVSGSGQVNASAAWYQLGRYGLTTCLMDDGYFAFDNSYDYSTTPWLDEYGGNPGTNIARGWLGNRVGSRPTAAAINGVWLAEFDHGIALCNPKGNGIQTVTAAQINTAGIAGSFHFFQGTQNATLNSGAAFASVTLQDSDGVLLLKG